MSSGYNVMVKVKFSGISKDRCTKVPASFEVKMGRGGGGVLVIGFTSQLQQEKSGNWSPLDNIFYTEVGQGWGHTCSSPTGQPI